MKTKKRFKIIGTMMLLLLMATGCGHQDLSIPENPSTEEQEQADGEKDMSIRSLEDAREIMKAFLDEKYDQDFIVELPALKENKDFIATAYTEGSGEDTIRVAVQASTGACRDNGCLKRMKSEMEQFAGERAAALWEDAIVQVSCKFGEEVPQTDRNDEDHFSRILKEEDVNGGIYVMIPEDSIDRNEEAKRIQSFLDMDALEGFFCEVDIYYVSKEVYDAAMRELPEAELLIGTSCTRDYTEYVRLFMKMDGEQKNLEEIKDGFR